MRKTKYENRYFDLAENVHYEIDEETGIFSFENLNKKLYELLENIEAEMLENSTILTDKNRQLYYERIKKRAANMDIDYFFVNDKPGQFTHTPEGEMRINSEIKMEQVIGLDKCAIIMHNGKEYPMGQQAVEERKNILKKHKHLIVQVINKYFPDLQTPQKDTQQKPELNETENDVLLSTIEDWLFEFKDKGVLTGANYDILVSALYDYLKTGQFPIIENEIKVGRVNKKLFGWNLNRILHHEGKGVETDLLLFAKNNISLFKNVNFDVNDIKKTNLYKYFTTQTK